MSLDGQGRQRLGHQEWPGEGSGDRNSMDKSLHIDYI